MPLSGRELESENMKRLERNYPRLQTDPQHRQEFHRFLGQSHKYGMDKPVSYEDLERAYRDFRD